MQNHKEKAFNKISNFFSCSQVRKAVEQEKSYSDRKRLIDQIIQRRMEIKNSEENFRLQKHAHIFQKMLYQYRKKHNIDQPVQQQQITFKSLNFLENLKDYYKDEMNQVIQKIQMSQRNQPSPSRRVKNKKGSLDDIADKNIQDLKKRNIRRNGIQNQKVTSEKSIKVQFVKEFKNNEDSNEIQYKIHLPQMKKYFTYIDPLKIQEQVESEIYEYLHKQNDLNDSQKLFFVTSNDKSTKKSIRLLESKVKYKLALQKHHDYQMSLRERYTASTQSKNSRVQSQHVFSNLPSNKTFEKQRSQSKNQNLDLEQSFASFTEIKLTNLYNQSSKIQKKLKQMNQNQYNDDNIQQKIKIKQRKEESNLKATSNDIFDVTLKKMNNNLNKF